MLAVPSAMGQKWTRKSHTINKLRKYSNFQQLGFDGGALRKEI